MARCHPRFNKLELNVWSLTVIFVSGSSCIICMLLDLGVRSETLIKIQ